VVDRPRHLACGVGEQRGHARMLAAHEVLRRLDAQLRRGECRAEPAPLAADTTPPIVNVQLPGGSSSARFIDGTTIDLRFTCVDYESAVIRCEDSEGRPSGDLLTLRLRDVDPVAGGVVVTVTAENAAGLTATATRVFEVVAESEVTVRTTATLIDGDLGWWNRGPVTLMIERDAEPGSAAGMMFAKLATNSNWMGTN